MRAMGVSASRQARRPKCSAPYRPKIVTASSSAINGAGDDGPA